MGLHPLPIRRRVSMAHKANPQICPRKRKNEVCMDKTFPLQVWQTTGLIRGTTPSQPQSDLHSDNLTASPEFSTCDDVPSTRHRQQNCGHPFSTASLTQPPSLIRTDKLGRLGQASPRTPGSAAPRTGAMSFDCPVKRQHMHHKTPAQTIKCVKIYTNASFLYVRSTL